MKVKKLIEILYSLPLDADIYAYGGGSELVIETITEGVDYVLTDQTEPVQLSLDFEKDVNDVS